MAEEQAEEQRRGDEASRTHVADDPNGLLISRLAALTGQRTSDSTVTVLVALAANLLVAIAKSIAAGITRSASMTAEAAHSWADTGNELFLVIADRRSARPADRAHPLGHGREAYVWSLFAAVGLFVAGGAVAITHGINELRAPAPADDFVVGYVVLALSFLLEGISFLRSVNQARMAATVMDRDLIEHVLATSIQCCVRCSPKTPRRWWVWSLPRLGWPPIK